MYMCKSSEGYRNLFRANVNMVEAFTLLALQAGLAPVTDVLAKPLQINLVEIRRLDA